MRMKSKTAEFVVGVIGSVALLNSLTADLKIGERLEAGRFTARDHYEFPWEEHARALEKRYGDKACRVSKEGEKWVAELERIVDLMLYTWGRNLDPIEKIENGILHKPTSAGFGTDKEAREYASSHPEVMRVMEEEYKGKVLYFAEWDERHDLVAKARELLAREIDETRWLPFEEISEYKRSKVEIDEDPLGYQLIRASYQNADRRGAYTVVRQALNGKLSDIDIFREYFTNPDAESFEVVKGREQIVVRFKYADGVAVVWRIDDGHSIELQSRAEKVPEAILERYQKLYPSVWTADYKLDRNAWFAEEGERLLKEMEKSLDLEIEPGGALDPYVNAYYLFYRYFDAPIKLSLRAKMTPAERREHLATIRKWWEETGRTNGLRKDGFFSVDPREKNRKGFMKHDKEQNK